MSRIPSFPITFEKEYDRGQEYLRRLKRAHPEAAWGTQSALDREFILFGEKMSLPPVSIANSNRAIINTFITVLSQEFFRESIFIYPTEHFDNLYEFNFASDSLQPSDYVKSFYEWFKHNDLFPLQKDVLACPINYGYTWHLVVVDSPANVILEGKDCNVYFVSAHHVTPQYSLAKVFTKYLEMAFTTLGYTPHPENFKFQELVLEDCASQSQVLCCVYMELVYKILGAEKEMSVFFSGIKPQVQRLKFEHLVFARYVQTLLNCFAVEHNPHGQIPNFETVVLEEEDLSWVEKTDIDRILNPARQMRVIRPLRQFAPPRVGLSEWESFRQSLLATTNNNDNYFGNRNRNVNRTENRNGDQNGARNGSETTSRARSVSSSSI